MRLDDLDVQILRALLTEARRSLRDVAAEVGSSPTTVGARLERMEQAGLVEGAALRLRPDLLPGRARLVEGRVAVDDVRALLEAMRVTPGVVEAAVTPDGRLLAILQVLGLEDEERIVTALARVGASGLAVVGATRATGPPPKDLFVAPAVVHEPCAVCGRAVGADALVETVDARRVVFCCPSCRRDYLDRYAALKDASEAAPRGPRRKTG